MAMGMKSYLKIQLFQGMPWEKLYLCDILTEAFIIHSIKLNCSCTGNSFDSLHFKECIHII